MATTHPASMFDDLAVELEPTCSGSSLTHEVTISGRHTGLFVQEQPWTAGRPFIDLVDENSNVVAENVADSRDAVIEAVLDVLSGGVEARCKALV